MTLVEVLVASIILLITMIPMGVLLTNVTSAATGARQRQAALQLADSWVEILSNSQPPTDATGSVLTNTPRTPVAPPGVQAPPSTLANTAYAVTAGYTENLVSDPNGTQSDLCTAGEPPSPSHPGVIQLKVTVTWNDGASSVSVTTEINYPKPGLQTEGFLAINLTNNGQPDVLGNLATDRLLALPVSITQVTGSPVLSPNPLVLYPDGNGCIFAQVPVGTYDVAVGQPTQGVPKTFADYTGAPPFVTTSGSTTDTQVGQVVTVTAEQTVQLGAFDEGINGALTYAGASAVDRGVACPATPSIQCVTFGDGASGASTAWGGATSQWSTATLAAGTAINQVDCTGSGSPTCVGVGNAGTTGLIVTTRAGFNATSADAVPAGVTDLTQLVCPSASGCYAAGTSTTGPVLLAGEVGNNADLWTVVAHPGITVTAIHSLACPTSSTCELSYAGSGGAPGVLRLDGDPAALFGNPSWTPTLTSDTLPGVVTSVGTLNCSSPTTCLATAVGDLASPGDPTIINVGVAASGPSTWTTELAFPTGASSVTTLSCASSTCVAIGTATGAPAVWTGSLSGLGDTWSQSNAIPTNIVAVTGVACGYPTDGDSAACAVTGVSNSASASGALLYGSQTNGSWAWNQATTPANDTIQYYLGVSCMSPPGPGNTTCAAIGATAGGPVVLSAANGPGDTWNDETPSPMPGAVVVGIPVETAPSGTSSWTTQVPQGVTPNATVIPNVLYPQANGYSLVGGDCPAEATSASTSNLNAAPGGTATGTVPLGLLPMQLFGSNGAPVSGAIVTITSLTCPGADAYNLPPTDATGVTVDSIPYGSYSYTVTQGSSAVAHTAVTMNVGVNSVQLQLTSGGPWTTYYLPTPVPVPA